MNLHAKKMALNIAVPLSGVGEFFEGFGLLSPISPISVDCRENLKLLVSPIGSESSGVSSLDPEESKDKVIKHKFFFFSSFFYFCCKNGVFLSLPALISHL